MEEPQMISGTYDPIFTNSWFRDMSYADKEIQISSLLPEVVTLGKSHTQTVNLLINCFGTSGFFSKLHAETNDIPLDNKEDDK